MKSYLVILIATYGVAHANDEYANCKYRNEMEGMDREKFEEIHNGYRSFVALGLVSLKRSMSLPASKMMGLKYDCDLENSAYESAKKCLETDSSDDNENLYVVEEEYDTGDPVVEAINWWSSEALDYDQKTEGNLYRSTYNISNFANLAWDTHAKVGCAVVKCEERTHVVCHYAPKGKEEGKPIYKTGPPCSECPGMECSEGVCYVKP